jgi:TRAP transporter TAXI family solute receptor
MFFRSRSIFPDRAVIALALLIVLGCAPAGRAAENNSPAQPIFITIGTGSVNGIYYPAGREICSMLQHDTEIPAILCSVEKTFGSSSNLKALAAGRFEFGLSQSDQLAEAYNGTGNFNFALVNLRTVLALYHESLTVIVRADSTIRQISDLKHKTVSTGLPGSGGHATMHNLMHHLGWSSKDIKEIDDLSNVRAMTELCEQRLDAVVFTTGHPCNLLTKTAGQCALRILPIQGPEIENLLKDSFAFSRTIIPGGLYQGINDNVESFGVVATLVSSRKVDKEIVYRVVKSIFENLDEFKRNYPLLKSLTRINMSRQYRFAPLHSGSIKYFQETGLLDKTSSSTQSR